ncbi:11202_t:CDS:2, partial [Funneliformis mosseae]
DDSTIIADTESTTSDAEILQFKWDKIAFKQAQELFNIDNNEVNNGESNYQIENSFNINDILTSCIVLDIIDSLIQYCSEKASNQHPLTQLIGSGKKLFSCENKHKDDTTKALELLGQWILNVAASEEIKPKEELLIKLNPVLTLFNQSISKQSISQVQNNLQYPSSLFLIKIALRVGKVDYIKLINKSYNFISKTSKIAGETF